MRYTKHFRLVAAFIMQVGVASPVLAQTEMKADTQLSYLIVHQPLVQFLSQLERDAGVQIDATESVNGMITDMRVDGDVGAVLTQLSQRFDLQWFAFNGVHYVSDQSEARMRLVRLGDVPSDVAKAALADSGLMSDRFPVADAAQGTAVALTGPPKLLGLSEAVIESVVIEPDVVPYRSIIVRRGSSISIESRNLSDIADRIAAQDVAAAAAAPVPAAPTETEGDS
ncbi:MAG: hypothetical protein ABJM43_19795 [Paracoccaceae bacterium]